MFRIAWDSTYTLNLLKGHRFPMEKYELLPQQLMYEGIVLESQLFKPDPAELQTVLAIHDEKYVHKLLNLELSHSEIRKIGFPLSRDLIDREFLIAGGTLQCVKFAFENGIAFNTAGGTHHAFRDRGEGFCLLNDQAIAAQYLLDNGQAENILIIDLDVHQGNGTAAIFSDEKRVFTFSMHGDKNYPLHKEKSDIDIPLKDGTTDEEYLEILSESLRLILRQIKPDFAFYLSGVDILSTDKLGRLSISQLGCFKRDEIVLNFCHNHNIPLVVCMGGGYSEKIGHIVDAHAAVYKIAGILYH